mmetsp:Transcript_28046/g.47581  ORF Transcript_28046/g.47581 Transcript_28046/m.47581 type:complete len:262 (-) Transcript_28046:917-1702(-)
MTPSTESRPAAAAATPRGSLAPWQRQVLQSPAVDPRAASTSASNPPGVCVPWPRNMLPPHAACHPSALPAPCRRRPGPRSSSARCPRSACAPWQRNAVATCLLRGGRPRPSDSSALAALRYLAALTITHTRSRGATQATRVCRMWATPRTNLRAAGLRLRCVCTKAENCSWRCARLPDSSASPKIACWWWWLLGWKQQKRLPSPFWAARWCGTRCCWWNLMRQGLCSSLCTRPGGSPWVWWGAWSCIHWKCCGDDHRTRRG